MRKLLSILLIVCFTASLAFARGHSSSTSSSSSSSGSTGKTVHVQGYTRKDGTHVAPHERSAPGTAASSPSKSSHKASATTSTTGDPKRDSKGKIERSVAAKDAFKKQHPCPVNGHTSGPCPGYVIDHVNALKHGGADSPDNMQWQTEQEAKAKDKWE